MSQNPMATKDRIRTTTFPTYQGNKTPRCLPLKAKSYTAIDLCKGAKTLFQKEPAELSTVQNLTRLTLLAKLRHNDTEAKIQAGDITALTDEFRQFAHILDELFFCGALTEYIQVFVFEDHTAASHHLAWPAGRLGRCRVVDAGSTMPEIVILLVRRDRYGTRSFQEMLATLVHEMVHAWYNAFHSGDYYVTEHEHPWQELFSAIMTELRTWHPSLEGLVDREVYKII